VIDLLLEVGGVAGVLMMLAGYAGIQVDRLDPKRPAALLLNLIGASLVLLSMVHAFNLPAFLMEGAWALVAAYGLARLAIGRRG
jgi:hypothetical protein